MTLAAVLSAIAAILFATAHAADDAPNLAPLPNIDAKAYFLIDFDSGHVLAEKNADQRMEPASLTKIMTAYIVDSELRDGKLKPSDPVTISAKAWRMGGSRMFARVGSKISVEELLKGVIIQSGNDATVALAEHIAGTDEAFAALMTVYAQRLGMTNTRFANSHGLPDPQHYTTPRDLATLSRALIRDFPDSYRLYSMKEYTHNGIRQYNRNTLLWKDASVDGIKTGHTDSAGYCMVASAKKGTMRLIAVILGAGSESARADVGQTLLAYGFRSFETHRLYTAQQPLTDAPLWKGEKDKLPLGLISDLYITIPRGQYKNLNASIDLESRIVAPAARGQQFGKVRVTLGDDVYAEQDLVAIEEVPRGGFVNGIIDDVKLWWMK